MHAWTYISNTYKYIHIYTKWIKTLRTAYPYGLNDHNGGGITRTTESFHLQQGPILELEGFNINT